LRALRDTGCTLGIISKSTEATIRDALESAGLSSCFNGPILGKALGFDGKVGFIEDMVRKGLIRNIGGRGILLVDDDVLELERARNRGVQTYAPPAEGGLRDEDFDVIDRGVRRPLKEPHRVQSLAVLPSLSPRPQRVPSATSLSPAKPPVKKRNLILFSGECFEG